MATLRRIDGSFEIPAELPVIALRDLVFFPYMVLPLLIGRQPSVAALEDAEANGGVALLLAQRDPATEDPAWNDLYTVGAVVRVVQIAHLSDGTTRVVLEGLGRARVVRHVPSGGGFRARIALLACDECETGTAMDPALRARATEATRLFERYVSLCEQIPREVLALLAEIRDRVRISHIIAGHLQVPGAEKQELLETTDTGSRFEVLHALLLRELELLKIEDRLDRQLGIFGDAKEEDDGSPPPPDPIFPRGPAPDPEWVELESAIERASLPAQARRRAKREFARLGGMNPVAPEASVIRTYLDWILALPWKTETRDRLDTREAARILEAEHYGLDEVKDRILDHIAVLSLVGRMQGPILCLVGPPGVGKTSLGRSIARCLERSFVRVSLGGVRDEAEIRGHRRTYVGALPGRIIQGMRRGSSRNPVFLLDELDKLAGNFHGDPGAALLEVLDPEQNRSFTDHYLELEFDLSHVLFIATANTLGGIPEPLRDRMEVIRLPGYLDTEKRVIARRFLWPRQVERHGLGDRDPGISDAAIDRIVAAYTREAGVRELERRLSRVARKLARRLTESRETAARGRVEAEELAALLGPPSYHPQRREEGTDRAGIACGLAWTSAGGEVLEVEVAAVPGTGRIQLTGTLGDVMKESAFAAVTYARSRARWLGLDPRFHRELDIHIHIPEGATPKDGPSAGITIAVALISALTDTPTRADLAMTGEITLRGRVLGVGGIKEKAVAARRSGIRRMLMPAANAVDIERIPGEVRERVEILTVETMDQVLRAALVSRDKPAAHDEDPGDAGGRFLVS